MDKRYFFLMLDKKCLRDIYINNIMLSFCIGNAETNFSTTVVGGRGQVRSTMMKAAHRKYSTIDDTEKNICKKEKIKFRIRKNKN